MCTVCNKITTQEKNTKQIGVCFLNKKKKEDILKLHHIGYDYFLNEKSMIRYKYCNNDQLFGIYRDQEGKIYQKFVGGNNFYCQDKLCPFCTKRIIYKKRKKILEFLDNKQELLKKNWYYIVLTIKHTRDDKLSDIFEKLQNSKKKLSQLTRNDRKRIKENKQIKSFFGAFDGIYWTIETTKTKNGWNVHLNIIGCTDYELELEKITTRNKEKELVEVSISKQLVSEWSRITKDSKIISVNKLDMSTTQTKEKAIQEVFKYTMKDDTMKPSEKIEFAKYTRGKKMGGGWGILKSMLSEKDSDFIDNDDDMEEIINNEIENDSENKEVINWDKLEHIGNVQYSFSWNGKNVVYKKTFVGLLDPGITEESLGLPDEYVFQNNEVFIK